MAHRIVWARRAFQDLEAIASYIAQDSPAYAGVVVKNIVNQTKVLARFPRSGRKVPEFDDEEIREVLAYNYRIIYRLQQIRRSFLRSSTASVFCNSLHRIQLPDRKIKKSQALSPHLHPH